MKYGLVVFLFVLGADEIRGQQPAVPTPVRRGLELWQADSADAAVREWSAAWSGPADAAKPEQIRQVMRQFAAMGGRTRGFEILGVDSVGAHLQRVYAVLRYERVPVFAQFVVYDPSLSAPAWQVLSVRMHTEPQQVLPASIWPD